MLPHNSMIGMTVGVDPGNTKKVMSHQTVPRVAVKPRAKADPWSLIGLIQGRVSFVAFGRAGTRSAAVSRNSSAVVMQTIKF